MTVSFTGLNNLFIGKKQTFKNTIFLNHGGQLEIGPCKYDFVKIKCNLSDDAKGNDLSEFKEALKKSGSEYLINKQKPDEFCLIAEKKTAVDDIGQISTHTLNLNGQNLLLLSRTQLPPYTYMAKLTRGLTNSHETSAAQKKCTNFANSSIHKYAINFIDNKF